MRWKEKGEKKKTCGRERWGPDLLSNPDVKQQVLVGNEWENEPRDTSEETSCERGENDDHKKETEEWNLFFFELFWIFFFFKRRCAYYYLLHDKPMALGCKHHLIFISFFFLKKQIVCDVTSENETKNKYGGRSSTNTGAILVDLDPLFRGVRLTHLFLKNSEVDKTSHAAHRKTKY